MDTILKVVINTIVLLIFAAAIGFGYKIGASAGDKFLRRKNPPEANTGV